MRENHNEAGKTKAFLRETKLMLKVQWKRAIWAVVSQSFPIFVIFFRADDQGALFFKALMMLFNFLSHGSQVGTCAVPAQRNVLILDFGFTGPLPDLPVSRNAVLGDRRLSD